jgi:hypothetical protein
MYGPEAMRGDGEDTRVAQSHEPITRTATKAERRAARASVGAYHEAELAKLIGRMREGLVRYDGGEIDAFEFDEIVHHYKRAAQKLWGFCVGSGNHVERAAKNIEWLREQDELPDWWLVAEARRRS